MKNIQASLALSFALMIGSLAPSLALAAPPAQVKTQAPGFFRMMLGEFEVTALYDGPIELDQNIFTGVKPAERDKLFERSFIPAGKKFTGTVSAYLIHTGQNLVLVDTGAAKCFGPGLGGVPAALKASGYDPAQVDTILITHLHGDHICGATTDDGKRLYPNAELRMAKNEADFWLGSKKLEEFPEGMRGFIKMARDAAAPYTAAGKLKTFAPGETLVPGIVADDTHGHTPGHTSYSVKSGDQEMVVVGDVIHQGALQFPDPRIAIQFDTDSKVAVPARLNLFKAIAKSKAWMAATHLPFPGIGHLRAEGKGYVWVPVQFNPVR